MNWCSDFGNTKLKWVKLIWSQTFTPDQAPSKAPSTPATKSKQHCRMLKVDRFFRQSRTLLRHCWHFWQQCRTKIRLSTLSKGRKISPKKLVRHCCQKRRQCRSNVRLFRSNIRLDKSARMPMSAAQGCIPTYCMIEFRLRVLRVPAADVQRRRFTKRRAASDKLESKLMWEEGGIRCN